MADGRGGHRQRGRPTRPAAALGLWADVRRWPSFVEGFGRVMERLTRGGPLRAAGELLFVRRSLRDALARTLARYAVEAEDDAGLRSRPAQRLR